MVCPGKVREKTMNFHPPVRAKTYFLKGKSGNFGTERLYEPCWKSDVNFIVDYILFIP